MPAYKHAVGITVATAASIKTLIQPFIVLGKSIGTDDGAAK